MPRTKAPRRLKRDRKSAKDTEQFTVTPALLAEVEDVRIQYQARKETLVEKRNNIIKAIRRTFEMAAMKLAPSENFKLIWDAEEANDENVCLTNSPFDNTVSTSVTSPEFQSVTSFATQSEASSAESRRSRSVTRNPAMKTPAPRSNSASKACMTASRTLRSSSNSRDLCAMPPPTRNRFCTPASNMVPDGSRYNAITPKVLPNSTMSVLRRPRGGEMAFAMTGSPLMVASNAGDDVCNVNLPLGDGRVLSILPTGLRPRELPEMSEETMEQLAQLRNNLDFILSNEPGHRYH